MTKNISICIRHAESVANITPEIIGGRSNWAELTSKGVEQSKHAARFLVVHGLDVSACTFHSSPAIRTLATARVGLGELGIDDPYIAIHDDLQELHQGLFEGAPRDKVYGDPIIKERMAREQLDFKLEGGQSMREVGEMGRRAHDEIAREAGVRLVFVHGINMRCVVGGLLGWDRDTIRLNDTPNTSITVLDYTDSTVPTVPVFALNPRDPDLVKLDELARLLEN